MRCRRPARRERRGASSAAPSARRDCPARRRDLVRRYRLGRRRTSDSSSPRQRSERTRACWMRLCGRAADHRGALNRRECRPTKVTQQAGRNGPPTPRARAARARTARAGSLHVVPERLQRRPEPDVRASELPGRPRAEERSIDQRTRRAFWPEAGAPRLSVSSPAAMGGHTASARASAWPGPLRPPWPERRKRHAHGRSA